MHNVDGIQLIKLMRSKLKPTLPIMTITTLSSKEAHDHALGSKDVAKIVQEIVKNVSIVLRVRVMQIRYIQHRTNITIACPYLE